MRSLLFDRRWALLQQLEGKASHPKTAPIRSISSGSPTTTELMS